MKALELKACAKVNLFLEVGPKRKDGYHSLETLFQEISLHDTLKFRVLPHPSVKLSVAGRSVTAGKENLVARALSLLKKSLGIKQGMEVRLVKEIPLGAGLGGGSSDAAAALWGGWILWNKKKKSVYRKSVPPLLYQLACKLGSDVPFFLKGGRAFGKGRGEKLSFRPSVAKRWMILVYPRVHVSTPLAYNLWDQRSSKPKIKSGGLFFNSFEAEIFKHFPAVGEVADTLRDLGCGPVLMSGSGSSVFGMVKNKIQGVRVKARLSKKPWDVFLVHFW